jgi:hypothetical protein
MGQLRLCPFDHIPYRCLGKKWCGTLQTFSTSLRPDFDGSTSVLFLTHCRRSQRKSSEKSSDLQTRLHGSTTATLYSRHVRRASHTGAIVSVSVCILNRSDSLCAPSSTASSPAPAKRPSFTVPTHLASCGKRSSRPRQRHDKQVSIRDGDDEPVKSGIKSSELSPNLRLPSLPFRSFVCPAALRRRGSRYCQKMYC